MQAGELKHASVLTLPEGTDVDINVYVSSEEAGLETRVSIRGVTRMARAEDIATEVGKIMTSPDLTGLANDWRLMTRGEIADYRKRQREEESHGGSHHQEDDGPEPAAGGPAG